MTSVHPDDPLALVRRSGLPEALRVLLETWPRVDWARHPAYEPLAAFWVERHLGFRRALTLLTEATQARLEGALASGSYGATVQRLGSRLVGELHLHHNVEDSEYFPLMRTVEPRLERGFTMLDADHQALDDWLADLTTAAERVLQAPSRDATGAMLGALERFAPLLERHLTDEEDLVVPVILKSGMT